MANELVNTYTFNGDKNIVIQDCGDFSGAKKACIYLMWRNLNGTPIDTVVTFIKKISFDVNEWIEVPKLKLTIDTPNGQTEFIDELFTADIGGIKIVPNNCNSGTLAIYKRVEL